MSALVAFGVSVIGVAIVWALVNIAKELHKMSGRKP